MIGNKNSSSPNLINNSTNLIIKQTDKNKSDIKTGENSIDSPQILNIEETPKKLKI